MNRRGRPCRDEGEASPGKENSRCKGQRVRRAWKSQRSVQLGIQEEGGAGDKLGEKCGTDAGTLPRSRRLLTARAAAARF